MNYDDLFKNTQGAHLFVPSIFKYVIEKQQDNAFGVFCQIVEIYFERSYFLRDKTFTLKEVLDKVSTESIPDVLGFAINPNHFYIPSYDRYGVFIKIVDRGFLEKENLYHRGVKDGFVWFGKNAFT